MRSLLGLTLLSLFALPANAAIVRFNGSFGEGGDGTGNWTTATSWHTGNVPTAADDVRFNWGGAVGTVSSNVGSVNSMIFGLDESNTGLNIDSGGLLGITGTARIGDNRTSTFAVNSGGTLNVGGSLRFARRDPGTSSAQIQTFNVFGTVGVTGTLQFGDEWNTAATTTSAIMTIGNGGVVTANNAFFTNVANVQADETLKLIIDGTGRLAINGDRIGLVDGWLADGFLEAGMDQVIERSFDGSVTTITAASAAVPEPSSLAVVTLGMLGLTLHRRRRS